MEVGTCTGCGLPYSAADVAGVGILRARPEALGGPRVEYRCPRCARVEVLVPHGSGRYAPPGKQPPEQVPPEARRPAWVGEPRPESAAARDEPPEPRSAERPAPPPGSTPGSAPGDLRLTVERALDLLGVSRTASREDIERAYRLKSLACHPDKVAHLDPDLQRLAEEKFKRLQEACRLLLA